MQGKLQGPWAFGDLPSPCIPSCLRLLLSSILFRPTQGPSPSRPPFPIALAGANTCRNLSPALFQDELDGRRDSINLARSTGQQLLAAGHPLAPSIHQALTALDQELSSLQGAWQEHQLYLQQAMELQVGATAVPSLHHLQGLCSLNNPRPSPCQRLLCQGLPHNRSDLWKTCLWGQDPGFAVTGSSHLSFSHQRLLSSVEKAERELCSEEASLAIEGLGVGVRQKQGVHKAA